jgi:glycosyltransferase involved in cell wall biosynthesis
LNILFSCGDFYPNLGGATSLVDDLARALLETGNSVAVLTRLQPGTATVETFHDYEIHRIDYPVLYEKFEGSRRLWTQSLPVFTKIWRLIRERSISTVGIGLLDMSAWYLFVLRPLLGFRLVLYLHGGETRALPAMEPSYASLLRTGLRVADEVIAVSEQLKVEAAEYWPAALKKTRVILNAIDFQQIRAAEPMMHPRRYIAAVGRLVPEKDFGTLIRAYAKVQQEIGEVDLIIAGEGKRNAELRQIAGTCPRPDAVIFTGRVERQMALSVMKGSMFVALPSVTEGFPIVAVEALALGKPLLGTSIPGIAALVEDGRQGNLFPPGDVAALADLIVRYCRDPELLRTISNGVASVDLRRCDIRNVAAEHLRVFEGAK